MFKYATKCAAMPETYCVKGQRQTIKELFGDRGKTGNPEGPKWVLYISGHCNHCRNDMCFFTMFALTFSGIFSTLHFGMVLNGNKSHSWIVFSGI